MKYLLDVNALLAWAHPDADGHLTFHRWKKLVPPDELTTCAITELGFVRISMARFRYTRAQAQQELAGLKREIGHYLPALPPPVLPAWVTAHAHTTDAYLCQVARAHGLRLATFDQGIRDPTALLLA